MSTTTTCDASASGAEAAVVVVKLPVTGADELALCGHHAAQHGAKLAAVGAEFISLAQPVPAQPVTVPEPAHAYTATESEF